MTTEKAIETIEAAIAEVEWICPHCGYCCVCGQALNWGGQIMIR